MIRSHWGQHGGDCYGCKAQSLSYDNGNPKTHQRNGDPWDGSPVAERINELRAEGRRVEAFHLSKEGSTQ